jgi:hypothetical protein
MIFSPFLDLQVQALPAIVWCYKKSPEDAFLPTLGCFLIQVLVFDLLSGMRGQARCGAQQLSG